MGVGSNIEPLNYIRRGLTELYRQYAPLTISSVYESEAIGFKGAHFYNLVVKFSTSADVYAVSNTLRQIEQENGRRHQGKRQQVDRTLDLDLLLYDDLILEKDSRLKIPRPDITRYAFVLLPLAEIAPSLKHPITQDTYADLWQRFDKTHQALWLINVNVAPTVT